MGVDRKINHQSAAVFLDRDGIINKAVVKNGKPFPPSSLTELELIDGIKELIEDIKRIGYKVFVFTNQPDVARGTTRLDKVTEIHDFLLKELSIDKIYCCFHDDTENCECRKPKPGMILEAQKEWDLDLTRSFVVGDRWRDIDAARAVKVRSILVDYNYNEEKAMPDFTCTSIKEVFSIIKKLT